MQRQPATLSGDDTVLKSVWDEVCVQVQHEHSFYWDVYETMLLQWIEDEVGSLDSSVMEAVWLQTSSSVGWEPDSPSDAMPATINEVAEYILSFYVLGRAADWSNKRIRDYLDLGGATWSE